MNGSDEQEANSLMEHFFRNKHVHLPRMNRNDDLIDRCMCSEKSHALSNYYLNRNRRERLVAYIRAQNENDRAAKLDAIKVYCKDNGYQLVDILSDISDHPSFGFKAAMEELENADGLISVDASQFIAKDADPMRELRPLIHHFFCAGGKHLITIADGIDTGTQLGQQAAIDLVSSNKIGFET